MIPFLKKGHRVSVVATAKSLSAGQIDAALKLIASWGLEVIRSPNLYARDHLFAGSDSDRLAALQHAIDDPQTHAVLFARGGYGTSRIIDQVSWEGFKRHPKWLCGFSDVTVVHAHVGKHTGLPTIHSTMPIFFADGNENAGSVSLKRCLFGDPEKLNWPRHPLNRAGQASGPLIGGNLAVLCSLFGTPSEPDFEGKILVLEDVGEYLYRLDRLVLQLKRSGVFSKIRGLVAGGFTDMLDNAPAFGYSPEEILDSAIGRLPIPVAYGAPIGHMADNRAIVIGAEYTLSVGDQGAQLAPGFI
ncbi:MAG: LD-carboxypeptidase [Salibacteraceae bacterium]